MHFLSRSGSVRKLVSRLLVKTIPAAKHRLSAPEAPHSSYVGWFLLCFFLSSWPLRLDCGRLLVRGMRALFLDFTGSSCIGFVWNLSGSCVRFLEGCSFGPRQSWIGGCLPKAISQMHFHRSSRCTEPRLHNECALRVAINATGLGQVALEILSPSLQITAAPVSPHCDRTFPWALLASPGETRWFLRASFDGPTLVQRPHAMTPRTSRYTVVDNMQWWNVEGPRSNMTMPARKIVRNSFCRMDLVYRASDNAAATW